MDFNFFFMEADKSLGELSLDEIDVLCSQGSGPGNSGFMQSRLGSKGCLMIALAAD